MENEEMITLRAPATLGKTSHTQMVTLYSGPGCFQCVATKRSFEAKGILFAEVDVSVDEEARQRLVEAGYRSLPVVEVDGRLAWSGFMPSLIDELVS